MKRPTPLERVYTYKHTHSCNLLNEKGITLIALIITIIILLILAGITIQAITSDNGLFARTKQAKVNYTEAQEKENEILNQYEKILKNSEDFDSYYNDFKELLSKANLENRYNSIKDLCNNVEDIEKVMNNKDCVDYIIKNTDIIMKEIIKNENAVKAIGKSPYAFEQVIKNDTWFNEIQNSEYADVLDEYAIKIPTLTDNTSNGQVTGSPVYSSAYQNYYAFTDGSPWTYSGANIWCPKDKENVWVAYEFNIEDNIQIYKLKFNTSARANDTSKTTCPEKYVLQVKINNQDDNENLNWVDCSPIYEISNLADEYEQITEFNDTLNWYNVAKYFKSNNVGKKFRLYVYKGASNESCININRLQIYGIKHVE